MRHVVALSTFALVVAGILATGSCGRIGLPEDEFDHQPALTTHTDYTVQEIDGCEYILYRVYVDRVLHSYRKYECRMIHKENCENHGLARELKEQF